MNAPFRPGLLRAAHSARCAHRALIATATHVEADGLVVDRAVIEVVDCLIDDLDDIAAGRIEPGRADDGLPYSFAEAVARNFRAQRGACR